MQKKQAVVSGNVLCTGIQKAMSRTEEPLLCLVRQSKITLIAVSGLRLVVSWEARLPQAAAENLALLLPPVVAELLSCKTVCDQSGVVLATRGHSVTSLSISSAGKPACLDSLLPEPGSDARAPGRRLAAPLGRFALAAGRGAWLVPQADHPGQAPEDR